MIHRARTAFRSFLTSKRTLSCNVLVHPFKSNHPIAQTSQMPSIYDTPAWVDSWASAVVADPVSPETVASRLNDLLAGKSVNDVPGILPAWKPKDTLSEFVVLTEWKFKPAAIDAVWHAIFTVAKTRGWTEHIRDQTYFWAEHGLLNVAWDAISAEEGDEEEGYDDSWITYAFGEARLFALGYGYSAFAWNALLDGLALGGEAKNSDSMRIGACAQLLGAGTRIKLHLLGGGEKHSTPGFAGSYLDAQPTNKREEWAKTGAETWGKFLKALVEEQPKAGPRAAALLKLTHEHLVSEAGDLASVEVADIIWPKTDA